NYTGKKGAAWPQGRPCFCVFPACACCFVAACTVWDQIGHTACTGLVHAGWVKNMLADPCGPVCAGNFLNYCCKYIIVHVAIIPLRAWREIKRQVIDGLYIFA